MGEPGPSRILGAGATAGWVAATAMAIVWILLIPSVSAGTVQPAASPTATNGPLVPGADFATYLGNNQRGDDAGQEQLITAASAASLQSLWEVHLGTGMWSQPIESAGNVLVGDMDGYEYDVAATTGAQLWRTFLGIDNQDTVCAHFNLGVTSSAAVVGGTVYVAGGNATFYALSLASGRVLWEVPTGNISLGYYDWASPLIHGGYAYLGISSRCDRPLVPAGVQQISLATHRLVHVFNSTAPGGLGNSVWSSPSLNSATDTLFVTTGNSATRVSTAYGESIVALNASDLAVRAFWQVPSSQVGNDSDFGGTPVLFTPSGGHPMVAAVNKNGRLYAWYQSNLSLAWHLAISTAVAISTPTWNGHDLFVVAGRTRIGTTGFASAVREIDPLTGSVLWRHGMTVPHTGYVSPLWVPGAVIVPMNDTLLVLNGTSGLRLFETGLNGTVLAPATVARGELYVGTETGNLYAFDVALNATAQQSAPDGPAPWVDMFSADVAGGLPAYSYNWSFGDGTYSTSASPTHTYTGPGQYTVTVRVQDLAGSTVNATASVDVT